MSDDRKPEVTILLCVWNGEEWIREAIDSCLAQRGVQFELLVIDDGSTDGTFGILQSYQARHPGIIQVHQIEHSGLAAARNSGFDMARGEFVTIIDADDTMHPLRCYGEAQGLRRFPAAVLCFSKRWNFVSGESTGVYRFRAEEILGLPSTDYYEIHDPISKLIQGGEYPGTSACTVRSAFSMELGKYDESLNCFEDGDMWLRSVFDKTVVLCPAPLYFRRVHRESMCQPNPKRLQLVQRCVARARSSSIEYSEATHQALKVFERRARLNLVSVLIESGSRRESIRVLMRHAWELRSREWLKLLLRAVVPAKVFATLQRDRPGSGYGDRVVTEDDIMAVDVPALLGVDESSLE